MRRILLAILLVLLVTWQVQARISRMPNQKPIHGSQIDFKHPLAQGLVGCWLMNERSGDLIQDLSGNANGTLINANNTWSWIGGGINNTATNNTDRINLGSITSAHPLSGVPTGEISVYVRCSKPADGSIPQRYPRLIDKSTAGSGVNGWCINWETNFDQWQIYVGPTSLRGTFTDTSFNGAVDPISVAFTINDSSNSLEYYKNGAWKETEVETLAFSTTTANMAIGNWNHDGADDRPWIGNIYNIYVWDRILTALEIKQIHEDPYCFFKKPQNMALRWLGIPGVAPPTAPVLLTPQTIINVVQFICDEIYAWSLTS